MKDSPYILEDYRDTKTVTRKSEIRRKQQWLKMQTTQIAQIKTKQVLPTQKIPMHRITEARTVIHLTRHLIKMQQTT